MEMMTFNIQHAAQPLSGNEGQMQPIIGSQSHAHSHSGQKMADAHALWHSGTLALWHSGTLGSSSLPHLNLYRGEAVASSQKGRASCVWIEAAERRRLGPQLIAENQKSD
jgi:hypothetical protein